MHEWGAEGAKPGGKAGLHRHPALRDAAGVEREDILNVGGFSDEVFEVIAAFAEGKLGPRHWVGQIEKIKL